MIGKISQVHLAIHRFKTAGGEIRSAELPDRVPFDAAELVEPLSMQTELLGRSVAFDLVKGTAVRIRLAKA